MVLPFWLAAIVAGINLLLLPYLGLILVTALAALYSPRVSRKPDAPRTRFLVVIQAHDEESGIREFRDASSGDTIPKLRKIKYAVPGTPQTGARSPAVRCPAGSGKRSLHPPFRDPGRGRIRNRRRVFDPSDPERQHARRMHRHRTISSR